MNFLKIYNDSTLHTTQDKIMSKTMNSFVGSQSDFSQSEKVQRNKVIENLNRQIQEGFNNLQTKKNSLIIDDHEVFDRNELSSYMNEKTISYHKKKMIVDKEMLRIKKLSRNNQLPKNLTTTSFYQTSKPNFNQHITSMTICHNISDLKLQRNVASQKEVRPNSDLKNYETKRISQIRKIQTQNGATQSRENESSDKISINPLIDQKIANKKGVIPKIFMQFKKQMDNEKNKKKVEIQDDYIRLKIKMLQKAKKLNFLHQTGNKELNLHIPCKVKPRKAEYKIIKQPFSNIKYAVLLAPSPLMSTNKQLKREILSYSMSADIKPSPQVLHSFKVPRTEVTDIQNNATLIKTNHKKYNDKVPIPFSNHQLPPKPYIKQQRSLQMQSSEVKDQSIIQSNDSSRSKSQRSNQSQNNTGRSLPSQSSFRIKQMKMVQKIYLNKSIKEFRKQLENIIGDQKRKMQDLEEQNSYFRQLANVSNKASKILYSGHFYEIKRRISRSFTRKEVSNLQNYKSLIIQQEEQQKVKAKENIRDQLCQLREQRYGLQELLFYLKKLKKQMKREKTIKQKFSKEKTTYNEIEESIELANILKTKIKEIQKRLYHESQKLLDLGIEICKDETANPLKFTASFSNKESQVFVKQIYDDENLFVKRMKSQQSRFAKSPTLEKKVKKAMMKRAELERLKKEQEEQEKEKQSLVGKNVIFKAFNKRILELQRKVGPVFMKPSSLDTNILIENFKLDQNYFEPVNTHMMTLQKQLGHITQLGFNHRTRNAINVVKFNTEPRAN
ncbi:UNKNOWN [Stylonychia lemnae]|uniref:Uncharacterized protein n=1 Tax=Stylonychia lemnae TaxID=5949 RepID=A0A078AEI7_STYLE|nr:UNKNOWN [Stylonychia lemnae]|eukprot:CDW79328.1 UNKNOWN [Stylonychia lemnae]